jgi:imidazolonepropionase
MSDWDLKLTDARIASMRPGDDEYGTIEDGTIAIRDGLIEWIGAGADCPNATAGETRSIEGQWLTPALIDCHTHLVFGGDRAGEFERRLQGESYEEIAAAGGGILATVRATRASDADELFASASERLRALVNEGVATVEIKSGYGLDVENELKMLEVARKLAADGPADVQSTLLAAHTVPPEYKNRADDYINLLCDELLPAVRERGLADAVDAYCETIAFDAIQVAKLFRRAQELGLPVKLHADQLSDCGGAELAAHFSALSADHLEYTSAAGVRAMAAVDTVAVLLPGAFLTLNETQRPPVAALRESGVPLAVATDCNPGTSPLCSIQLAMWLATRVFGLTPAECLAGTTRNAALALGLADRGVLAAGKRADIAAWDVGHPRELAYWLGRNPLSDLLIAGQRIDPAR